MGHRLQVAAALELVLLAGCGAPDFDALQADASVPARARTTTPWTLTGGPGWAQYADLELIHRGNVRALRPAWTYRTGESAGVFQATPILAGGRLVFCTPHNRVIALDPATGAELWRFDPQIPEGPYGNEINCRGVAQWTDPSLETCPQRILTATNDARLLAVDARTGERCPDFGDGGSVDLQRGVGGLRYPGEYQVVSPPAVVGDVAVVGASIADNQRTDAPSGVVRGYSVRTGELLWGFDFAPPDFDRTADPVSDAGWALATANVWTHMSADAERDLVFLPTGNPAPDYARPAQPDLDHYGSSVVALRASTGELVWHFQTVRSDFWDFDVPSAPALVDLTLHGETVPALVQATKMGFVFVLHRETGEPLVDVAYRAVPQHGPLADRLSPVQPFPPEAFRVSRDYQPGGSFLGLCDGLEAESVIGPVYTPITERWTIGLPSNMGATNWGGVAVDPRRGLILVNANQVPFRTRLISRADAADLLARWDAAESDSVREAVAAEFDARFGIPPGTEVALQEGTDYLMARHALRDPWLGVPCAGFPLAEVLAIDIAAGAQIWRRPHGTPRELIGVPLNVGAPGMGGPLATAGGLLFLGGAAERVFRAYDVETGELFWQHPLPAPGNATPMSYVVSYADGGRRQFVVVAAGGDRRSGLGGTSDYLLAFALED